MLHSACLRLLAEDPDRQWVLPEDREHGRPGGSFSTAEVIGWYRRGKGIPRIHFDPRMSLHLRDAMGLPTALPPHRRHWKPATTQTTLELGLDWENRFAIALRKLCARLLADPADGLFLPKGIGPLEPQAWFRNHSLVAIYSRHGSQPVYYFDPRLIQAGIITKQTLRAAATALTPEDITADMTDPALLAEREKWRRTREPEEKKVGSRRRGQPGIRKHRGLGSMIDAAGRPMTTTLHIATETR
jgi:hypothetical protein